MGHRNALKIRTFAPISHVFKLPLVLLVILVFRWFGKPAAEIIFQKCRCSQVIYTANLLTVVSRRCCSIIGITLNLSPRRASSRCPFATSPNANKKLKWRRKNVPNSPQWRRGFLHWKMITWTKCFSLSFYFVTASQPEFLCPPVLTHDLAIC